MQTAEKYRPINRVVTCILRRMQFQLAGIPQRPGPATSQIFVRLRPAVQPAVRTTPHSTPLHGSCYHSFCPASPSRPQLIRLQISPTVPHNLPVPPDNKVGFLAQITSSGLGFLDTSAKAVVII